MVPPTNSDEKTKSLEKRLKDAIHARDMPTLRRLFKGGVDANSRFWYGVPILHEAVATQNEELVRFMIQAHVKVNAENKDGRTALHIAARLRNIPIVKQLLEAGARVNAESHDYKTSLHVASWKGHWELAKVLIDAGADVNRQDQDGTSPLHWAASKDQVEIVKMLIRKRAVVNVKDEKRRLPLHLAVINRAEKVIAPLIQNGSRVDLHDSNENLSVLGHMLKHPNDFTVQSFCLVHKAGSERKSLDPVLLDNDHKPVSELLSTEVRSLVDTCRIAVRDRLIRTFGGKNYRQAVRELPLPKILTNFMLFEEQLGDGFMLTTNSFGSH